MREGPTISEVHTSAFARRLARLAAVPLAVGTACSSRHGAPEPVTEQGEAILSLWRLLFWSATAVGVLVLGLIAAAVVRGRRGPREGLPAQLGGNVRVELFYTAASFVLAAVIFGFSVATEGRTKGVGAPPDLVVDVTGFQWQWRFHYPAQRVTVVGTPDDPPELVLPTDSVVRLRLLGADVIHSFFVPEFLTKRDVVPGTVNELELRLRKTGRYEGNCTEFCGLAHARMNFTVRVVTPDEFRDWAASAVAPGVP